MCTNNIFLVLYVIIKRNSQGSFKWQIYVNYQNFFFAHYDKRLLEAALYWITGINGSSYCVN